MVDIMSILGTYLYFMLLYSYVRIISYKLTTSRKYTHVYQNMIFKEILVDQLWGPWVRSLSIFGGGAGACNGNGGSSRSCSC